MPGTTRHFDWGVLACTLLLGKVLGCSHTLPAPTSEPRDSPQAPSQERTPAAADWELIRGSKLPVDVRVPFGGTWQRKETSTSLRLERPDEGTRIVIRLWHTGRAVSLAECHAELALAEAEAVLARRAWPQGEDLSTPGPLADDIVVSSFQPTGDFRGVVRAALQTSTPGQELTASVMAVAAGVGKCVALVANTRVYDERSQNEIVNRIAWLVEGVTKSVRVRSVGDHAVLRAADGS